TTYLSEDIYPKVEGILRNMQYYKRFTDPLLQKPIPKSKAVFDDKKVTDHHAIIPTGVNPSGITPAENQIYDLIAKRFISVFYPECKVSNTMVLGQVGTLVFKATGKQILEPGWRVVYEENRKSNMEHGRDAIKESNPGSMLHAQGSNDEERVLPSFTEGEKGPHAPLVHKGKTSPPKPYTEATLLRAMETAGKQVENEEMRELMKDNGIGRPSTRANIIETLFRRKYIEKNRKNILATQTGMDLIDTIQNDLLKSPELTGNWERKLRLIEKGEYELDTFKQELFKMVRDVTDEVIFNNHRKIQVEPVAAVSAGEKNARAPNAPKEKPSLETLDCPKCKSAKLMKGKTAIGCANFKECGFKIPFELLGKKLTETQLLDLIQKGKTGVIKGFIVPGSSATRDGRLLLDGSFNVGMSA
ncbi:MAG: DNA topoisomerase, partial [Flavobacteriia bacterium]